MAHAKLQIFYGPDESQSQSALTPSTTESGVQVRLGEVLPLLADAVAKNRAWVRDFEDEAVTISSDLYDVLMAYEHYRRPSA